MNLEQRIASKRWNPACDDREAIRREADVDRETLDRVLDAFMGRVFGNLKTTVVGLAKFEWRPLRNRLPNGKVCLSRRLVVTPSRYVATYARDLPVLNRPGVHTIVQETTDGIQ